MRERATEAELLGSSVRLALHGSNRGLELPIAVEHLAEGALQYSGELRIRQRDFGLNPESNAGVVNVADEVDLNFRLVATPATWQCPPTAPG